MADVNPPVHHKLANPHPKYPERRNAMGQLRVIQRTLMASVEASTIKPSDLSQVARAWKELEMLRMVKLGKAVMTEKAPIRTKLGKQTASNLILLSSEPKEKPAASQS